MSIVICTEAINLQASHRSLLRFPRRLAEFEIQAFLFSELNRLGYRVRGEVATYRMKARFDLVIFDEKKKPLRIIEVKRGRCGKWHSWTNSGSQIFNYQNKFGIPVDAVGGLKEAKQYIACIPTILPPPISVNPDFYSHLMQCRTEGAIRARMENGKEFDNQRDWSNQ